MTQKYVPTQPRRGYLVELEEDVWLAPWSGDPGRTTVKHCAKRFPTRHGARVALGWARKHRPFENAKIEMYCV